MLLRDYMIGIIFFSLWIASFTVIATQFDTLYGTNMADASYNSTYNKITDIDAKTDQIQENMLESDTTFGSTFGFFASGAWNVLTLILGSLTFLVGSNGIIYGIATDFGVPLWFASTIMTAISLIVILVVVSTVFRRRV